MTTLQQHIEDLDIEEWAALTKRAAMAAVAAADQLGIPASEEVARVAAMSERELVDHRNRFGSGPKRLSPLMRLVQADQLRVAAERQARQAEQDKQDADAAAQMARDEAEQSARVAEDSRQRVRAIQAEAARKDAERADQRLAEQQVLQQLRTDLEQAHADHASELAAAHERTRAAEARAQQRATERAEERAAAQQALEELRGQLERAHADHASELAAAHERTRAAEARAQQRATERAEERAAAQQALEELRGQLERAHADHAAELAAARGQAEGQVSAVRQAADERIAKALADAEAATAQAQAEVERIGAEAEARVAAAHEHAERQIAAAHLAADERVGRARADAQAAVLAEPGQLGIALSVPIPTAELRAHTGPIEDALAAVREIDYLLEAGVAEQQARQPWDIERVRILVHTVQQQAWDLAQQLRGLPGRYTGSPQVQAADSYATAAASVYGAFLQRIAAAVERLAGRGDSRDAEIVEVVAAMLDEHPWRDAG
ncbi:hypothetical protein [Mycobacterium sp. 1245852.3]|uniref:hypothetical protein n=1 Tax=Mycobacterium sp. 1245852.3 TaxID=1856860 RepID=UPI0008016551|nr:hypothetical protein [Mycobacterium sp. 1245852.3]OBK18652.1 hypothetical protein A9W96_06145 [Mycobacterium sp. 1245852.3]